MSLSAPVRRPTAGRPGGTRARLACGLERSSARGGRHVGHLNSCCASWSLKSTLRSGRRSSRGGRTAARRSISSRTCAFPDVPEALDRTARRPRRLQFYSPARAPRTRQVRPVRHWFSNGGDLAVQADGRVVPCCLAHSDEEVLGHLATESLRDVWQVERFRWLRRALFTPEGLAEFAICERCNFDLV